MPASDVSRMLEGALAGGVLADEPLSRHTTYRIGGPAAAWVTCASLDDLKLALEACRSVRCPWTVVGKGSNILASDGGYQGAAITLGGSFRDYRFEESGELEVGAGTQLAMVVQEAFNRSLTGFEFAVGIPGTVGGAIAMNAGTRDEWMGRIVREVRLYSPLRGAFSLSGDEVEWGYRTASLPDDAVIVSATLALEPGASWAVRAKMEASLKSRRASQPLGEPSAGSVFKNPEGTRSAQLIEACGLKGLAVGGAQVSEKHANFIVNTGGATAADVFTLMCTVRQRVREAHGIELQPEVRFLGFAG